MFTKWCPASIWAARTSGNSSEPLRYVHVPRQLITVRTPIFAYGFSLGASPTAARDLAERSFAVICASSGEATRYFMNERRFEPLRVIIRILRAEFYFLCFSSDGSWENMMVPKFSGTWLGSRLTTQVCCQHMKWR